MDVETEAGAAIRTRALRKDYGRRTAVADLDLSVRRGEVFGFLGPNGAGKSTTIRVLLDLLRPTSGWTEVLGVNPRRGGSELRRRIGYLPSDFTVYERDSAGSLLRSLARLRGGVANSSIGDLAKRLDLDLARQVRELSKGNLQKVGLVQAFMHDPELLVLDEPTAGLDPLLRQEFIRMVADARAAGRTVFLSSHILSEVQTVADRVGMIRDGRLIAVDTVDALRQRAVRRVEVQFADLISAEEFTAVPGIAEARIEPAAGDAARSTLRCRLTGSADPLIKACARHHVDTLQVEEPDLEDVFLALYAEDSQ